MQMRASDPPSSADRSNLLTARDGVSLGDEHFTHVKVSGDDPVTVIDVHHVAGEKEFCDKRDYAPIRCAHW